MATKINGHVFKVGASYKTREVKETDEYKEIIQKAEKYIRHSAVETVDGIYWSNTGNGTDLNLYNGSAGVLYFYLELLQLYETSEFRDYVDRGAGYLARHWRDFTEGIDLPGTDKGYHFGLAGIGTVLLRVEKSTGHKEAGKAAGEIAKHFVESAKHDGELAYWSGFSGIAMDSGIDIFLIDYNRTHEDPEVRKTFEAYGRWLLNKGQKKEQGIEYNGFDGIAPISLPNFEFGNAGTGYLLTLLYEETKDEKFLDGAIEASKFLETLKVKQSKGSLIPHHIYGAPDEKPVFYLSSCHGPAGTSKLYYKLYQHTGDESYLQQIEDLVDGIESVGAPEKMSPGFWNNVTLCCGNAGLLHFFVGLYEADGKERWINLARRTAAVIIGEAEEHGDESISWPSAWERVKPEFISNSIGYYDGTSGIAATLGELYAAETGPFHWQRLPDDPFPEERR